MLSHEWRQKRVCVRPSVFTTIVYICGSGFCHYCTNPSKIQEKKQ